MKAVIFDIKRFAVHDGDGIRTTVFFKGCPLKCVWCHNPEGLNFKPQIAYYKNKCISCGECVGVCPSGAHRLIGGLHAFERKDCIGCGACEGVCLGKAIKFYGKEMTVEEVLSKVLEDKNFYLESGGGVTLSGGECLMQADFCQELLKRLKEEGIHTAVDTCGYVDKSALDKVIPYTDVFLYDLKAFDSDNHIKCTGKPNDLILDNLKYLDGLKKDIELRVPFVPDYNDDQMQKIVSFVSRLKSVKKVKVLPYHNLAGSKYQALGIKNTLPEKLPEKLEIEKIEKLFCR